MKHRFLLFLYLVFLVVMLVAPMGKLNTTLSDTFFFELRLDYLVHVGVFMPLVVLWRLGFPRHSWWKVMGAGMVLAVGLEGVQYLLPYRSWNVNDAVANAIGVAGSGLAYWLVAKRHNKPIRQV